MYAHHAELRSKCQPSPKGEIIRLAFKRKQELLLTVPLSAWLIVHQKNKSVPFEAHKEAVIHNDNPLAKIITAFQLGLAGVKSAQKAKDRHCIHAHLSYSHFR